MTRHDLLRVVSLASLVAVLGGCEAIVSFDRNKLDGAVVDMTVADTGPRDLGPDTGPRDMGTDTGPMDAGLCTSAAMCDDTNACTTDTCSASGMCMHAMVTGCCNHDADCDDSMVCTTDTCDMTAHTCTHPMVSGCCTDATMCDDTLACTTDTCDTTAHTCMHAAITSCCTTSAMCDDSNVCTMDSCTLPAGTCSNTMITGCCLGAGDCNDGNTCTTDACDTGTHMCTHTATTGSGCCMSAADCDDSDTCTADACNASHMCTHTGSMGAGAGCCGAAADCNDSNVCTDDSCDGTSHCVNTNNTAACTGGTCSGGTCVPSPPTCAAYCTAVMANCTMAAGTLQYNSMGNCMDACNSWGWAVGTLADTSGNTLGCRQNAATAGTPNCAAAGPTGGTVCGTSLCADWCAAELAVCTGANMQYADMATCMTDCGAYTAGTVVDTTGPTLGCRTYHLEAASTGVAADATFHCPHTAMDGGGASGPCT